ncbi:cysteine desulfurase [Methanocalculus chunghsingensis]|uniref:Cysteine desulfurase IscS n=1 Tax=Methanocalculus chunghsingensis TaxID=156457 RepID=A0A8J7W5C8_9EURY|nr:cysteine desulfurase NifS [Methanocalculus chunghsingensis]MBR1368609.1 cysteine desulfurase [Methanocalculus chunghsingensis]
MENKHEIYLDNAATTRTHPDVVSAMLPYFSLHFGNPSSLYSIARSSRTAIEEARRKVAAALGADEREIFFTSGGTESDNWAIRGIASAHGKKGRHIITTAIEHHAVLHTVEALEKEGFEITYLPVDEYGMVSPESVEEAIRPDTILISVMLANNEIGTIQPVQKIGEIARSHKIIFHSDAVQAIGQIPVDVRTMNVDLLSISAHKFGGPKGVGALFIRRGLRIDPLLYGGAQEQRRRAGTENVPGIVGLGAAIERAAAMMSEKAERMKKLRKRLIDGLLTIPKSRLNGHPTERLPNNVNIIFDYIEGESILLLLDANGIAASTGSACTSASLDPSHVLLACGLPHEQAHGSLRLTLGEETTEADIDYVLGVVPTVVQRLRDMSPLTPKELRTR